MQAAGNAGELSERELTELVELLQALIRIPSVNPPGDEILAARYLEQVLADEGLPPTVVEPFPGRGSIVCRLHGDGTGGPSAPRRTQAVGARSVAVGFDRVSVHSLDGDALSDLENDVVIVVVREIGSVCGREVRKTLALAPATPAAARRRIGRSVQSGTRTPERWPKPSMFTADTARPTRGQLWDCPCLLR